MSNSIYPSLLRGLAFTVLKSPTFSTIVQKSANQFTTRIVQSQNPIWTWALIYEYLYDHFTSPQNVMNYSPYTDLATLMGFFLARQGQYDDFLFSDPDDNSVGPGLIGGAPSLQAQLQVVNDGAGNYYSPVQRNMGGLFYEDVTDLNGPITVYANASLQTSGTNYSLLGPGLAIPGFSFRGLYLKWLTGAPPTPVTATFNFYFRVRFKTDEQDFEKFLGELWTIGGTATRNGKGYLELESSRISTV